MGVAARRPARAATPRGAAVALKLCIEDCMASGKAAIWRGPVVPARVLWLVPVGVCCQEACGCSAGIGKGVKGQMALKQLAGARAVQEPLTMGLDLGSCSQCKLCSWRFFCLREYDCGPENKGGRSLCAAPGSRRPPHAGGRGTRCLCAAAAQREALLQANCMDQLNQMPMKGGNDSIRVGGQHTMQGAGVSACMKEH